MDQTEEVPWLRGGFLITTRRSGGSHSRIRTPGNEPARGTSMSRPVAEGYDLDDTNNGRCVMGLTGNSSRMDSSSRPSLRKPFGQARPPRGHFHASVWPSIANKAHSPSPEMQSRSDGSLSGDRGMLLRERRRRRATIHSPCS